MFNELFPSGSWGSIEYGAKGFGGVEGGRWKPLHYSLRASTYADHLAACNQAGECFITNDRATRFEGAVSLRLLNVQTGTSATVRKSMPVNLSAGAGIVQWFCAAAMNTRKEYADTRVSVQHDARYKYYPNQIPTNLS
eukprot:SAG31_NODE_28226_length_413_cov_1.175159_1_plen_137_part_11